MTPEPQIPRVPEEALSPVLQAAVEKARRERGDATFLQVMAHAPSLLQWYQDFYQQIFYGGQVPVRFKEIARLRLSTLHGCAFCNRGNRLDARRAGLSDEQIAAIDSPGAQVWSDAERAVLELAERLSLNSPQGSLDPGLYDECRRHFSDAQIVELGLTMAILVGMAKFLFTFDLVEKESYCQFGSPGAG
ncbi:MAG: carboxymuconolactone decarboxylase family protein [Steroidobacteraceae bacterium]